MDYPVVKTYEEAGRAIADLGILPLSGFIPAHPSLDSITEADAWHTETDADPWQWRDRFAGDGIAAYGRFLGSRPSLVARELFPLVKCALTPTRTPRERYASGLLARSTVEVYEIIAQNQGVEVRDLRKRAGMQNKEDKNAFDHALIDLQNATEIVISGVAEHRDEQGNVKGWNGTCYMLAEYWMDMHDIQPLALTAAEASKQILAWLEPRWEEQAIRYLQKKFFSL